MTCGGSLCALAVVSPSRAGGEWGRPNGGLRTTKIYISPLDGAFGPLYEVKRKKKSKQALEPLACYRTITLDSVRTK